MPSGGSAGLAWTPSIPTVCSFRLRREARASSASYQYQSRPEFNTDYKALEMAIEKRMANRWSGRISYTLSKGRDVGAIWYDTDLREDYGLSSFDNRHALAAAANVDIWKGLSAGFIFRYYSGNPINETVGTDFNGDGDNNDRPIAGINDLTQAHSVAARQPGARDPQRDRRREAGAARRPVPVHLARAWPGGWVFLEVYNLTNETNFGNPTGNRNSSNFMIRTVAGDPRTVQLGLRYTF